MAQKGTKTIFHKGNKHIIPQKEPKGSFCFNTYNSFEIPYYVSGVQARGRNSFYPLTASRRAHRDSFGELKLILFKFGDIWHSIKSTLCSHLHEYCRRRKQR